MFLYIYIMWENEYLNRDFFTLQNLYFFFPGPKIMSLVTLFPSASCRIWNTKIFQYEA